MATEEMRSALKQSAIRCDIFDGCDLIAFEDGPLGRASGCPDLSGQVQRRPCGAHQAQRPPRGEIRPDLAGSVIMCVPV